MNEGKWRFTTLWSYDFGDSVLKHAGGDLSRVTDHQNNLLRYTDADVRIITAYNLHRDADHGNIDHR